MALSFPYTPGSGFTGDANEFVTIAKLIAACTGSTAASGTLDTNQITARAVTPAKAEPAAAWFFGTDAGTANAHVVTGIHGAVLLALVTGQKVRYAVKVANSGAVTVAIDSIAAVAIKKQYNQALAAGDLRAGQIIELVYDGTNFQLTSSISGTPLEYVVDSSGAANTLTVAPGIALTGYVAGHRIAVKVANTNTGATNINVSGLGNRAIFYNGAALTGYEMLANEIYDFIDDGTRYQLVSRAYNKRFTFTGSAITGAAGTVAINEAHGLNGTPTRVRYVIVCITNDTVDGTTYLVGDELEISCLSNDDAKANLPFYIAVTNATNCKLIQAAAAAELTVPELSGGGIALTAARWKPKVYAEL